MTTLTSLHIQTDWLLWLTAIWLLWLPGMLLTHLLRIPRSIDILLQFAIQIGLGLAFWPVFLLWTSTLGWRWSPKSAQITLLLLSLSGLLVIAKNLTVKWRTWRKQIWRSKKWLSLFGIITALTTFTRLLHIRDLTLPVWVDSVTHTMIVRMFLIHGTLPQTFAPFVPTARFAYHWGYHANVIWSIWLLNRTEPLAVAKVVLQFGQLLNVLTVLMLYAGGRVLFKSRRAGLLTAMLAGLVSWFPAYYLSLGRYTQLTGLLILPIFGIMLWRLHNQPTLGGWLAIVLLSAGLFIVHMRVALYAITLAITLVLFLLVHRNWQSVGLWLLAGGAAIFLTLPWLLIVAEHIHPQQLLISTTPTQIVTYVDVNSQIENYSYVLLGLLWIPHNAGLLALVSGGISGVVGWGHVPLWGRVTSGIWLTLLIFLSSWCWHQRQRYRLNFNQTLLNGLGLLLGWCTLTALFFISDLAKLFGGGFLLWGISGILALFIPLSLAGGGWLAWLSGQFVPFGWVKLSTALIILLGSLWGTNSMINIVNPVTVLDTPADVKAMSWIRANTSPDAYFAINIWPWFQNKYIGADGGYWLTTLTNRRSILPATTYNRANIPPDLLHGWSQLCSLDDPNVRRHLQAIGVDHIYIGNRGGHLCPEQLINLPFLQLIYQDEGVHIFKFTD